MNDRTVFKLLFAYMVGLAPFMKLNQNSLQIPVYSQEMEAWALDREIEQSHWKVKNFLRLLKVVNFATRPLIWHLKERGILTFVWVCNDE